jgi:hypothetical protein
MCMNYSDEGIRTRYGVLNLTVRNKDKIWENSMEKTLSRNI